MDKTKTFLRYLKDLWGFMEYHNNMAPFPPYDTEYVKNIKDKLDLMEENKTEDYDNIPVAACTHCKSLHIQVDDVSNDHCMRCGAINEITIYDNIAKYLEAKQDDSN